MPSTVPDAKENAKAVHKSGPCPLEIKLYLGRQKHTHVTIVNNMRWIEMNEWYRFRDPPPEESWEVV